MTIDEEIRIDEEMQAFDDARAVHAPHDDGTHTLCGLVIQPPPTCGMPRPPLHVGGTPDCPDCAVERRWPRRR